MLQLPDLTTFFPSMRVCDARAHEGRAHKPTWPRKKQRGTKKNKAGRWNHTVDELLSDLFRYEGNGRPSPQSLSEIRQIEIQSISHGCLLTPPLQAERLTRTHNPNHPSLRVPNPFIGPTSPKRNSKSCSVFTVPKYLSYHAGMGNRIFPFFRLFSFFRFFRVF